MSFEQRSIPTEDRISSFPDHIICHILSFLPTKLSAATSILSKRWNPLWLSVLNFHFDDQTFQDFISFRHFVLSAFLSRQITLPLQSFHLKCSKESSFQLHDINRFVYAAAQRQIQNLNLEMSCTNLQMSSRIILKLPRSIFSCRTLIVLHLKGLKVNDLSHVAVTVDFPFLKTLHMSYILFESIEYFVQLLSGCLILEELQVEYIRVSNIEWLVSQEMFVVREKFRSLPKLIKADITKSPFLLTFLLTLFCKEEAQVLRAEVETRYLNYLKFPNLTYMELILHNHQREKWKILLETLKSCPKLQNIIIHEGFRSEEEVVDNWMDPAITPECLSTQLRTCLLKGFKCTECELQFAKYIMQNSKVLNTMSIKIASSVDINVKYQLSRKSASWTRASSTCKLLFMDES